MKQQWCKALCIGLMSCLLTGCVIGENQKQHTKKAIQQEAIQQTSLTGKAKEGEATLAEVRSKVLPLPQLLLQLKAKRHNLKKSPVARASSGFLPNKRLAAAHVLPLPKLLQKLNR